MKKATLILAFLLGFTCVTSAQSVTIGTQVWMSKNLDVAKFRNGDPIPEVKTDEEWKKAEENHQPAWCYYKNDSTYGVTYGKLYNWFAVNDLRGLAPQGWHVASFDEWDVLLNYLGGDKVAGRKLKSTSGWSTYDGESGNGTNESGFMALPGGARMTIGTGGIYWYGGWWCATPYDQNNAIYHRMNYHNDHVNRYRDQMGGGFSVRCLKD